MEQFAKLQAPPPVKFKDLEEVVSHQNQRQPDAVRRARRLCEGYRRHRTGPITIQIRNRDITFQNKEGIERGTVNIFGRVTTLTGKIVQTFEDTVQVDVPAELLPKTAENSSVYWKALPLRIEAESLPHGHRGERRERRSHRELEPRHSDSGFQRRQAGSSSLIIADQMEPVATKNVGTGQLRDRNHESAAPGCACGRQADSVQAQPENEFLDAGLQSQRGRKNP